ncbi:T6SS effector BTH_I2691 family protein [Stenotrophomonas maltophilia]|uniref:T6SS effector BTH_I2691 family protein n=1 Tax=Stenotrophomonas maltophilia TaxID=40324 RepID=A0AAJ2JEH7_STEMA|nr:T6SS effector BTH_I2691 family protein [Stenotrophomonas maltophilia]MDT3470373.1 T6SS effector BTH_I2691 family protein [Stenotrophomonas maltophilia]
MTRDSKDRYDSSGPFTGESNVGIRSAGSPDIVDLPAVAATLPDETEKSACDVCRSTGLAILPVRYTVVPASCNVGLGGLSPAHASDVDVSAAGYTYALRTLRQGLLYLYYEQGPYGPEYWECYAIAGNGTLWRQPTAYSARAIAGGGLPSCGRSGHDPMRTEFITIQRPHVCGTVWLAYSQHPWTPATLDRYGSDPALRAERMQSIEPARWITSARAEGDQAPLKDAAGLASIMEYRWLDNPSGDPPDLPYSSALPGASNPDGALRNVRLHAHGTRYPWSRRDYPRSDGVDPRQQRFERLKQHSSNGRIGSDRQEYPPMLLGLWDAVGVVHELSGYCNDLVACINQFKSERELEVSAVDQIEQISRLLELNGAVMAGNYAAQTVREVERQRRLGNPSLPSWDPKVKLSEEEKRELAREYERQFLPLYLKDAQDAWKNKYWPLIDEPRFTAFKRNMDAMTQQVLDRLGPKMSVLVAWLRHDLLLATLEDFDGKSAAQGEWFEEIITEAIAVLGMHEIGRALLTELSHDIEVTGRKSLLWRVIAKNDEESRKELQQTLTAAQVCANTILDVAGAGWAAFVAGTAHLKSYLALYRKLEAAQKEAAPPTASARILRESGVDRFVTTAGAYLLNRFPMKGIQDTAGNAMVRFVLLTRALMERDEAISLVAEELSSGQQGKRYFLERIQFYRTKGSALPMQFALRDLELHHGALAMRKRWQAAAESSRNVVRLNSLTAVLEMVNFIHLATKVDKDTRDYATLLASGMSLVAVYTGVHEAVAKEFFGAGSASAIRMKVAGSVMAGAGSLIGAYYSLDEADRTVRKGNYAHFTAHLVKGGVTGAAGTAHFLTALAYSCPVIERTVGRNALTLGLRGLHAGLEVAAGREGGHIVASRAMKRVGVWILRLSGWEAALIMLAIEALIWAISPNELEKWCESNSFGKRPETKVGSSYATAREQQLAFENALGAVSARVQ